MTLRNGIQLVLQYPDVAGGGHCRGFSGLPVTTSHYIFVEPTEAGGGALARQIGEDLAKEILALGPTVREIITPCGGYGFRHCHALDELDCNLCYVPVVGTPTSAGFVMPIWSTRANANIVPAIAPGISQTVVPPPLQLLNQVPAIGGDKVVLHDILRTAGIFSARPRIFISYLRSDASTLAEQLHTELVRKGFEVFLDRFSILPGADFQKRLDEELIRMGTVLLIESKNLNKSRWIRHEIDFALLHRLGIISLRLPGGKAADRVTPDDRIELGNDSFTKSGRLKRRVLQDLLLKISSTQTLSENMRINYLTGAVSYSLADAGFACQSFSNDQVIVAKKHGGVEHAIRISGLPAELQDFHALDPYSPTGDSLVISPGSLMDWRSKNPIEWLGHRIGVKLKDESEIAEFPRGLR